MEALSEYVLRTISLYLSETNIALTSESIHNIFWKHNVEDLIGWCLPSNITRSWQDVYNTLNVAKEYMFVTAVACDYAEIVKLLLGTEDTRVNKHEPLYKAVCHENTNVLKLLLNDRRTRFNNVFDITASLHNVAAFKLLLEDKRSDEAIENGSALMSAVGSGSDTLVALLLKDSRIKSIPNGLLSYVIQLSIVSRS